MSKTERQHPTKFYLTTRNAIKRAMKHLYNEDNGYNTFEAVGALWGVSPAMAWKMIKVRKNGVNYFPKDPEVLHQLEIRARLLGFQFPVPREKDLFGLPTKELKRRIEQRELIKG